jgi:hypothetical protein
MKRTLSALFVVYLVAIAAVCVWQHTILFAWPAGIVTGNLLASCIWAPLAVIHLDRLARKHHREHMGLLHRQHQEHLAALADPSKIALVDGKLAVT